MYITFEIGCSSVSKVVPKCAPKKSKCTKGALLSFDTKWGCRITGTFKSNGKKQFVSNAHIQPSTCTNSPKALSRSSPDLEETVVLGQLKCMKATYEECKVTVTYKENCSKVSKVVPNCTPKKNKCTKGVLLSFDTQKGCIVTGTYKNTGKKQTMTKLIIRESTPTASTGCPQVIASWSEWGEWSGCNSTSPGERQFRLRHCMNSVTSSACEGHPIETASCTLGILVIGSYRPGGWNCSSACSSVEFWSPTDREASCTLEDYPRDMNQGPTANFVAGQLIACFSYSCEKYNNECNGWTRMVQTRRTRKDHSSAQTKNKILLMGGRAASQTTEWIPMNHQGQQGPFYIDYIGNQHCTIQVSSNLILVTGGFGNYDQVTKYQLTGNATRTVMTPLNVGRFDHACGVYWDADGQRVLLVTGGMDDYNGNYLSSTEVAVYSESSPLVWRDVEGGKLPSPRLGLRATVVGNNLYVSGGRDENNIDLTSVLSWNPAGQSWQEVGNLAVARYGHAAVVVPISSIRCN